MDAGELASAIARGTALPDGHDHRWYGISGHIESCVSEDGKECVDDHPDGGQTHDLKQGCCEKGAYVGRRAVYQQYSTAEQSDAIHGGTVGCPMTQRWGRLVGILVNLSLTIS